MRIERLYNALVLGGAGLVGCSVDGPSGETTAESDVRHVDAGATGGGAAAASAGSAGGGGAPAVGLGGTPAVGGDSGAGGAPGGGLGGTAAVGGDAAAGAGGTERLGDAGFTDAGETGALGCSSGAVPTDPCGCPCCWVADCGNDEPCCAGFCASGDDGKGCCGP